ncbi:NRDE family protein [Persicimonas caeni]|uniref:NRDE family protein n=1 Tax=Persicimonas caeni TaxID=2292766 RepID=A0A4Y6PX14_PERCE|nr:NRDE family protein [Persicimonas caeni]QDG52864.1 NRDE family protein [Persicimonas caeni]QED34086.1 NRDE family protein [Persicimonas caeni]
MCTVILAYRLLDDAPILLGANRDEHLARPSEPPRVRADGALQTVAPKDLKAGGTWLGLNERGVLVAITNRFGKPADPSRRSRGELVSMALEASSAHEAAGAIAKLSAHDYNGFHLLCVDREGAYLVWSDGEILSRSELASGLLVLTERSLGAAANARKERVLAECRALLDAGELDESALQDVLSQCNDGSIDATCVRIPSIDYGTRSSTIVRLGDTDRLLHADGPPCSTPYEDLTVLLEGLTAPD